MVNIRLIPVASHSTVNALEFSIYLEKIRTYLGTQEIQFTYLCKADILPSTLELLDVLNIPHVAVYTRNYTYSLRLYNTYFDFFDRKGNLLLEHIW